METSTIRSKLYILIVVYFGVQAALITPQAFAASASSREYQVKAAFLYNFIQFTEWPAAKIADNNNAISIGIIGDDPFGAAFDPVKEKSVKNKKMVIKRFGRFTELIKGANEDKSKSAENTEALRKCHVLFVCDSEKENLSKIIEIVKDSAVLTVGQSENFLDDGGIIRFIKEAEKVAFEVNIIAAKEAGVQVSSQVLRLAKRVITEETADDKNK